MEQGCTVNVPPYRRERAPLLNGPISEHARDLDDLLWDGRFDESDIGVSINGTGLVLTVLVPDYGQAQETSRSRFGFRRTFKAPLYPHHVRFTEISGVSIRDESETYGHVIRSIDHDLTEDALMIDCAPSFTIVVRGAHGSVLVVRGSVFGFFEYKKFGFVQTESRRFR